MSQFGNFINAFFCLCSESIASCLIRGFFTIAVRRKMQMQDNVPKIGRFSKLFVHFFFAKPYGENRDSAVNCVFCSFNCLSNDFSGDLRKLCRSMKVIKCSRIKADRLENAIGDLVPFLITLSKRSAMRAHHICILMAFLLSPGKYCSG